ncbi:MAG: C2 family cysteine protease [Methanoregulaceae archaeon]|nr:C2 family cysteine protease [Methanoregulaceae archaeon]
MMMRNKRDEKKDEIWMSDNRMSGVTCTTDNRVFSRWSNIGRNVYNAAGSKYYVEPIQGCVNDCYFIAALASGAWAANSKLKTHPNYRFYKTTAPAGWGAWFTINDDLPVDTTGNLVYARSSSLYIWPCLYEKAYAVWKAGGNQTPVIGTVLNGGNGLDALLNIFGGVVTQGTFIFDAAAGNKTKYPSVAKASNTNTIGLTKNHTYSVLRKTAAGIELRNPCGGAIITVPSASFTAVNFSEWGYVIPA